MSAVAPAERERALELLAMRAWTKRQEGMRMLIALGDHALVLQHALAETDASAIVEMAVQALHPEPLELVRHHASMVRGQDANLVMEVFVPAYNYLYAEEVFLELYRPRRPRLKPGVVRAIGLAGFRRMGEELLPHWLAPGRKDAAGLGEEAAAAAASLRRLDLPLDATRLRARLDAFVATAGRWDFEVARIQAQVEWALFDAGEHDAFEYLAALWGDDHFHHDVATTLLKRGRLVELDWYVRSRLASAGGSRAFCHWPLLDYVDRRGLRDLSNSGMAAARARGIAPPPWWQWGGGASRGVSTGS